MNQTREDHRESDERETIVNQTERIIVTETRDDHRQSDERDHRESDERETIVNQTRGPS